MTTEIGPGVRFAFMEAVKEHLYSKAFKNLRTQLWEIITDNSIIHSNFQKHFSFRGSVYAYAKPDDIPHGQKHPPMNLLNSSLRDRMKKYLVEVDKTEREEAMVLGYVLNVVGRTDRTKDLLALLPDSLHYIINDFAEHLIDGEGKFTPAMVLEFKADNIKYEHTLKARMMFNLIDQGV